MNKKIKYSTLIVDLDELAFVAALRRVEDDDPEPTVENSQKVMIDIITSIQREHLCKKVLLVMEHRDTQRGHRRDVFAEYKNRDPAAKSQLVLSIKFLIEQHNTFNDWPLYLARTWESDDIIAYLSTQVKRPIILCSDKDLWQVPGISVSLRDMTLVIDHRDPLGSIKTTTRFTGFCGFLLQAIMGDKIDNVPGLDLHPELMLRYKPTVAQIKAMKSGAKPVLGAAKRGVKTSLQLLQAMTDAGLTIGDIVNEFTTYESSAFRRNCVLVFMHVDLNKSAASHYIQKFEAQQLVFEEPDDAKPKSKSKPPPEPTAGANDIPEFSEPEFDPPF